jgi:S-adenosylmethionine:tRNA ribosyltransferase-isomerase
MRLEELDFYIPEGQIAQEPAEPRDSCRLMFLRRDGGLSHGLFSDLPELLKPGDTLVFNDSRVLPARLHVRKPSGGAVELRFLQRVSLARPSHRLRAGGELLAPSGERLRLVSALGEGRWVVEGPPGSSLVDLMEAHGLMPLPPYIKSYPAEPSSYQTVYAVAPGSAAAPTAGLHFTPRLLHRLGECGMRTAYVTLHVGLDTFQPIREQTVEQHRIHRETYSVRPDALDTLQAARRSGQRLVAVGTTATRVLETLAKTGALDAEQGGRSTGVISGATDIFITPGYGFRAVDALLTNFHLPRSTVLALAMAFTGPERLREAYSEAIRLGYRFFSFGDAMLIEPCARGPLGDPGAGDADV